MKSPRFVICEISDLTFSPEAKLQPFDTYKVRTAARGVLIYEGKIALLNVTKKNYHKLPGGGIESGESNEEGFRRELLEETGSNCELMDEAGVTIEYRDQFNLLQISYIYLAKVVGTPGKVNFVHDEIDDGFKLEWVPFNEIESVMNKDNPTDYEGRFISLRDKEILAFYKDKIK
ncbi:MAG: NUDIX domain-containing protein [bacterium]|nr:NUDIX domain-containing protein [bacterium]